MKPLPILLFMLCLYFAGTAQVYTFKPGYSVKLTYGGGDMEELWFEKIDQSTLYKFTVDLDNKAITIPDYKTPAPIEKISRDEQNNTIILKMKGDKEVGMVWGYWEIKMNKDGSIIYIRNVERLTGKRFKDDTFFHLYTNDLRTLFFNRKCTWVKSNMALSKDKETADKQVNELFNSKMTDGENTLGMRNGYFTWTEGHGKKAIVHHWPVDSVSAVNEDGLRGAVLTCSGPDGVYKVFYMYTKRNLDPSQYSWSRYITIDKYVDNKRTWKMVFR